MNNAKIKGGKWYDGPMQELQIVSQGPVSVFIEVEGEEIFLAQTTKLKRRISGPYKVKVTGGDAFIAMPFDNTVQRRSQVHTNMDRLPEESGSYDNVRNGARLDRLRDMQEARKLRMERRRDAERAKREVQKAEELRKEAEEAAAAAAAAAGGTDEVSNPAE